MRIRLTKSILVILVVIRKVTKTIVVTVAASHNNICCLVLVYDHYFQYVEGNGSSPHHRSHDVGSAAGGDVWYTMLKVPRDSCGLLDSKWQFHE